MNNQILSIQKGIISQVQGHNVLKNGSSVFVKVIANKGNGVYLGSVAGNRVNINSARNLKVGSSFVATISTKNGTIYITPKADSSMAGEIASSYIETGSLQTEQLATILSSLGMPATALSESLLKMMKNLDMKVDGQVLREIYSKSLKHKSREKAAGELLMILRQKGIDVSQEELEALLDYLERDFNNNGQKNFESEGAPREGKKLVNKMNGAENGWVLIPYNIVETENEIVLGTGVLRMLFNSEKKLDHINLNCFFNSCEYLFSLSFQNEKCSEIKFNINPADKSPATFLADFKKYIKDKSVDISWCDSDLIEGFGSLGSEIIYFEGEA